MNNVGPKCQHFLANPVAISPKCEIELQIAFDSYAQPGPFQFDLPDATFDVSSRQLAAVDRKQRKVVSLAYATSCRAVSATPLISWKVSQNNATRGWKDIPLPARQNRKDGVTVL
jgi:hypothetical protein